MIGRPLESNFKDLLGIEPTEEERQAFLTEARKVYSIRPDEEG
jgi:hypothetical protein